MAQTIFGAVRDRDHRRIWAWLGFGLVITVLSVLSSLWMSGLEWNGVPVAVGGFRFFLTVYPPLIICTWALFWLGFSWAFVPAYLSTLIVAILTAGMPLSWALLFALADPLGLAVYGLAYRVLPLRTDLRGWNAIFWFLAISLCASFAGSSAVFIWATAKALGPSETFATWEGWWLGAFLQSALIVAPVLALATRRVESWRDRWLGPQPTPAPVPFGWGIGVAAGLTALIGGFLWTSVRFARANLRAATEHLGAANPGASDMASATAGVDLVVIHGFALFAVVAIGAVLLASSWNRALAAEVEQRTAALRESEERYALAARATNDGLWDWDLRGSRAFYSPRWLATLGLEPGAIGETIEDWLALVHPEDREAMHTALRAHVEARTSHFEGEYRLQHRDGTFRWMLVRGLCVRDARGRAVRVAGSQSDITERRRAEDQLVHGALHDNLTGLPNRVLFLDRLSGAIARSQRHAAYLFAVLFLDLDRFKVINDSLGHAAGDRLLVAIAKRLSVCLRPVDTVARLGGDEFAILLDDIAQLGDAAEVATRIHDELAKSFDLSGNEVFTSASIGIATSKTGYTRPEDVLRDADTAMYRAKTLGKARHQVFDSGMHARAMKLLLLESDLRRATEQRNFALFYQPVVRLADGTLTGFEGLLRWIHPTRGSVPHEDFLPLAEETGLIAPIGNWVIEEACRTLAEWTAARSPQDGLAMSFNVSPRQLTQADLVEQIERAITRSGVAPERLRLEITEGAIIQNADAVSTLLGRIKALGVAIDLDDFGTGYSSLSYLHRLPIDRVKIDRSFVGTMLHDAGSMEIVRAILGLALSLEVEAVAEGIETVEQAQVLGELGCQFGQGFYFRPPLGADEARAYYLRREVRA